jgi:hypothetical protein
LIGVEVQIAIEEDGTDRPPLLPPGRIARRLIGPDRGDYYLVELKRPVTCLRAATGKEWQLSNLVIATKFAGDPLYKLLSRWPRQVIQVGIANYLEKPSQDDPTLDLSKIEYFALGTVRRS